MKNVTIPIKLISLLSDGNFHSEEKFSRLLRLSAATIKKEYIPIVRDWGVNVLTVHNKKGYRLCSPLHLLNKSIIQAYLSSGRLSVVSVIDSTNQYLIDRIGIIQSGDACIAEYQIQGRGRRGRKWISSFGNDLYLSLYWRFQAGLIATEGLSLMVGIVMAKELQRLGVKDIRIKWPNDLYLNNRKLAGILVEIFGTIGDVAHIVIGIGINLEMRSKISLEKINQKCVSLIEIGIVINRNTLAAKLINILRKALKQFEHDGFAPFVSAWCNMDNFFEKPVKLFIGKKEIRGVARGVDNRGNLLLEQDGQIYSYFSEETSLRGL
ncbi:bifunctional biotin--[acetyl-CoA-carboxylase] ligase/biotin operon repressor BirA [Sodalis sp. CWE]|uniref:bifunctional biotin--[acetyl-CoA-carboxylase] ligase/biotin operon repressor BirA n=1 Tax=Sodalis sp. CWE TaxID=2803816 RepID=UPI001C7DA27C|nr:bifunctional biotin--[acetyl-CoA-carboxylase] ligase/biotin operon repressor BirA [Sodalis sp. CWE]MBX4181215.1 bifunctional biotin--[acetyl-CoA-carboxylase] ligase/biotin operon repressor BirA [Sodalis sp. CWE]